MRTLIFVQAIEYFRQVLGLQHENGDVWGALGHGRSITKPGHLLPIRKSPILVMPGAGTSVAHTWQAKNIKSLTSRINSIGVLYYNINQFRDALNACSRAIRINPYISEVWFDLGSLYESCNNQISDAIDAYARAAELDPGNPHITQRLNLLRDVQANNSFLPTCAPVHAHTLYCIPCS
ncbi:Lysine-specific demethylase 6A [Ceratobasidium sp. UAMH 11750]|nr:Lysine-specific demethylase 6A [Ceratobasidium sp. UAMH 11750]